MKMKTYSPSNIVSTHIPGLGVGLPAMILIALLGLATVSVRASDPVGVFAKIDKVVFEPNEDKLWARVKDSIRLFLRTQWRNGALFGRTEDEAFFITIDRTTMTQDDILNGRLIAEIGIAPVRPAEFVIFRIFQHTAEAQR